MSTLARRGVFERGTLRADQLYARLLATAVSHAARGRPSPPVALRSADGALEAVPVDRWLAPTSAADDRLMARAVAPVLDVGCGPGRLLEALVADGKEALGVDLVPAAVGIARSRGGQVIEGSIFAEVPDAGRWQTALVFDGNIGIGGWPAALLERVTGLLAPGGEAIVELDPPGAQTRSTLVRIETVGHVSDWFAWARVSVDDIGAIGADAGLTLVEAVAEEAENRWFARLVRPL